MANKRRGRGEGGISQRKDGTYCASVSLGFNEDGSRRRLWAYGKTKGEVATKLDDLRRKYGKPGAMPSNMPLRKYLEAWLQSTQVAESTRIAYGHYIAAIEPHCYGMRLDRLTPGDIALILSRIESKSRKLKDGSVRVYERACTRKRAHAILRKALGDAQRQGLILQNPATLIDAPAYEAEPREPFTLDEVKRFLKAIKGDALEAFYLAAVLGGFREGELLSLAWRQVDLDAGTVQVRRTVTKRKAGMAVGKTAKTKASLRPVPLPEPALEALRRLPNRTGLVFPSSVGTPLSASNVLKRFYNLLEGAKLPRITIHDLRHTHATMLLALGVHPKVVQERLGHSSISVTLGLYSHVIPGMQDDAVERITGALE